MEARQEPGAPFREVTRWLIEEGRFVQDNEALFAGLVARVRATGLPLLRCGLHLHILHPQLVAVSFQWWEGAGVTRVRRARYAGWESGGYDESPIAAVYRTGEPVRRRLGPEHPRDFPILDELAAGGGTDYYAQPLVFDDRTVGACATWCTSRPERFSPAEIEGLDTMALVLSTLCELRVLRGLASTILDTYIGRTAGRRVLAGTIARGSGELLHAVVWYCDLRGFTARAEAEPASSVIALLNAWFERMVGAVQANGGEVLKFIGDGMLAIFPIAPDEAPTRACEAAVAAARRARTEMEALDAEVRAKGGTPVGYGLALHVGEVTYGNIGAPDRLDFTAIGPAVNMAARVEGLCRSLGPVILATSAVARQVPDAVEPLGRFRLKGIEEEQEVWRLRE